MPQLDTAFFLPQLVWLAITFVILYLVMARLALPRIGEVLEARQDRIAHDLDAAASLRVAAETALAEYQKSIAAARAQAQGVLAQAAELRANEAAGRQAKSDARIAEQLGAAEQRIGAAKRDALDNIERVAVDIARAATARLIGVEPADPEIEAALAAVAKGEG